MLDVECSMFDVHFFSFERNKQLRIERNWDIVTGAQLRLITELLVKGGIAEY